MDNAKKARAVGFNHIAIEVCDSKRLWPFTVGCDWTRLPTILGING